MVLLVQVPVRGLERRLLVDLLHEAEQAPLRRLSRDEGRVLLQALGRGLARLLVRGQERRLSRDEDRALFRAQIQHPEQALFRFNERWLVRGLHIGPMLVLLR